MNQFSEGYLIFLAGLGWMVVSWTVVPEVVGLRALWWLVGFGFLSAFSEAIQTTLLKYGLDHQAFAASSVNLLIQVAASVLLLAFLRRTDRADPAPLWGRWLYVIPLAVAALVLGGEPASATIAVRSLGIVLLAAAARRFWHLAPPGDVRRPRMKVVAAGFALLATARLAGLLLAPAAGSAVHLVLLVASAFAPWIVCLGITEALLVLIGAKSHLARGLLLGVALTPLFTPLIERRILPYLDQRAREQLVELTAASTARFDPAAIARLTNGTATAGDRRAIETQLAAFQTGRGAPERTYLWTLRDGHVIPLSASGELHRATGEVERQSAARGTPFLQPGLSDGWTEWLSANAPLPATTPQVWLAFDHRLTAWRHQRETTRYFFTGSLAVSAIFLTIGLMLTWRLALEDRRYMTLRDSETASRAKSEFLTFLSHELRTPLQSMLGRTELLALTPLTPPQSRHLDTIGAQGQLLLRLVTDLLDLGTIEAGKFALHPAPFSLRRALSACEDVARRQLEDKPLEIAIVIDPDLPDALIGDEVRLRQVLGNLLGNAVKYTASGQVTLRVSRDVTAHATPADPSRPREMLAFQIIDTGPGLPPNQLNRLFTLFTRLNPGDGLRREGTGVGLALVRRLCTLMGGSVSAANRPEGGACFTVRLGFTRNLTQPTTDLTPETAVVASTPRRILVVEDNRAAREFLAEALAGAGHRVEAVVTGEAALVAAAARPPDIIILDLNLPDMDGIEVTRRLRAAAAPERGPCIIGCSAEAFDHVRQAALAAGMDDFLQKPVSLAALSRALPSVPSDNIFDRLAASAATIRARNLQRAEWPRLKEETVTALAAGDHAALRRLGHYLLSTALLTQDHHLADLSRRLGEANPGQGLALIGEVDAHLNR